MFKTLIKVILWALGLIFVPWLLITVISVLAATAPIIGTMILIFLPIVMIGAIIGYIQGKKK